MLYPFTTAAMLLVGMHQVVDNDTLGVIPYTHQPLFYQRLEASADTALAIGSILNAHLEMNRSGKPAVSRDRRSMIAKIICRIM